MIIGWAFFAGAAFMLVMCYRQHKKDRRRIMQKANAICAANETVLCINATVIVDDAGRVSWFNNENDLKF